MRVGISIPLFNEADSVTEVVASMHSVLHDAGIEHTLVLVNNGSRDATREAIDALAVPGIIEPIHLRENAGYGGGILTGLAHLEREGFPEIIGWAWGDGQVNPTVLPHLYHFIKDGADIAKAVRTKRNDGPVRQAITSAYAAIMRVQGTKTRDINGCPKLMTREAFLALEPTSADWFIDAEVIVAAERKGMNIQGHPVTMHKRTHGSSKVGARTIAEFGKNILIRRGRR